MKSSPLILALSLGFFVVSATAEETSVWLTQNATLTENRLVIPDQKGAFEFLLPDASGVTIGGKPDVGSDEKSIEFSGTQQNAFKTTKPFPIVTAGLELTMAVKASASATTDGAVLRYGTQWEIRYNFKSSKYTLAVWTTDPKVFTMAVAPAKPGVWQLLKVSIKSDAIMLTVDEATAQTAPKGPIFAEPKAAALQLGGVGGGAGKEIARPFTGSVADIHVTVN